MASPRNTVARPQAKKKKKKKKLRWYWKLLIALAGTAGATAGGVVAADKYWMGGILTRSLRAYAVLAQVGLDYNMHSKNPKEGRVTMDELHDRNAKRVCDMIKTNGGMFLKIGQAIAVQGAALPEAYRREFEDMFDDAAQEPWSDVQAVIREEFGAGVSEVFGEGVEREPRASASIAQVHYARLRDGREVAIKVQKRRLAQQASWDLWTFKVVCDMIGRLTEIPFQGIGDYIMDNIMKETDFQNEAANAVRIAELIESDAGLGARVYIPKVYGELTTRRVLTSEWIHGAKLWDKDVITGEYDPSGEASSPGMGLKEADVMATVVELFSSQMFKWGFVHCDPHPGNMFVRRLSSGKPQIVLIDHGLYVSLSDTLRRQYARFWKSLLTGDQKGLDEVSAAWGMKTSDAWADTFMSRQKKPEPTDETAQERSERLIGEAAAFFGEDGLYPRELVFLERNLALVQGSNRFYDSPVNRLGMIGRSAMLNLHNDNQVTFSQGLSSRWAMFVLDAVFYISRWRQYMGWGKGFEAELKEAEERMAQDMKDSVSGLWEVEVDEEAAVRRRRGI
ncbi:abc1 domain-containing [Trichoderma cornu-damae]|uniref:Abc1 domain-containing n=1 Tax=Trichoderma cornu-damae TaxID=654480 RepID=A0A9P8QLT5_9HYPO|nr:abc1 domain-containing [Trichoderma cornu-damae]